MFNRFIPVLTLSAAVAMASAHLPGPFALACGDAGPEQVAGQILIKVTPGKESSVSKAYVAQGFKLISTVPHIGWQLLKLPSGTTLATATTKLKNISGVLKAEPNVVAHALETTVNDPRFSSQYALQKMQLPLAWDISTGTPDTIVAVVDSGVDYTHPDLMNKVIKGKDFIAGDNDPMDVAGHGTHCAGIVAAETNNGIGVAGTGYNTKILAVRVLGDNGSGSYDAVAQGIVYSADNGANIISMSLGSPGETLAIVDDAIAYANDQKNVLVIAAAGNSGAAGNPHFFPAYNAKCLAVGASDSADKMADFSEHNVPGDAWVDVAAPGVNIMSTLMGNNYGNASGTSMACPNTAGVASLVWATLVSSGVTPTNTLVRQLLEDNTDNIGTWIIKGRINAFSALNAIGVPVTVEGFATTPEAMDGATFPQGNDAQTLQVIDSISLKMLSKKKSGVGLTGSFATNFPLSSLTNDELRSATLNFRVSGDKKATIQLYLYDNLNGKWVLYSAKPATVNQTTLTFNLSKTTIAKYSGSEGIRLMVRSLVPTALSTGALGITTVDKLTVTYKGVRKLGSTP